MKNGQPDKSDKWILILVGFVVLYFIAQIVRFFV